MGKEQQRKCNLILLTILTNPFPEPLNSRSLNFIYDEEDLDQALLQQHDADQYADPERQVSRVTDNLAEWTRGLVEAITRNQAVGTRKAWDESSSTISSSTTSRDEDYTSQISSSDQCTDQDPNIRIEDASANFDDKILEDSDSYETVNYSSESSIESGRRRMIEAPIFRTRVRLFHKTVKDYILHSTSFRKLQSDHSDLHVMETHVKLRLLELGPVTDDMPNSWPIEIHDYVYEIFEMNFGESVSINKQIPWSICKTIGLLMPTRGSITLSFLLPFFTSSFSPVHSGWAKKYVEETSFPHFAAFFGHPEALEEAQCESYSSQPGPNLLLSACLGRILHSGDPVHAGTSEFGIITKLLDLGYSGHDHIGVIDKGHSMTVWQFLVFLLSLVNPQSSLMLSSVDRLLKILTQLLKFEPQKEVLILLPLFEVSDPFEFSDANEITYTFSSFITIQDVVESFHQSDSRDSLLRRLNNGPHYKSKKPPAWLHALNKVTDNVTYKIQEDLQRLSPEEYSQWVSGQNEQLGPFSSNIALVTSDIFLVEESWSFSYSGIPLW